MTTKIKESVNKILKYFQIILVNICENIIAQQMSTININMINTITSTLEEHQLNQ